MEIVSLKNHIVRKALCLSLNEMAVLCDIKQMSQNPKYGFQCIKSKDKIAEWLDLSRATVFNAIATLEKKGYIERTEIGIKPTQFIYDLDSCQEEIGLYVKSNDIEMITKKVFEMLDGQSKIYTIPVQNLDGDSLKFRPEQSKIYTQDINRDINKELQGDIENQPKEAKSKIPTEDEFVDFYRINLSKEFPNCEFSVRAKYESWKDSGWKDGHGQKITNWKNKLKNTIPHLKPTPNIPFGGPGQLSILSFSKKQMNG